MPLQVINGVGQARIRGNSSGGAAASFDADAQTFITNASISDSTQQNALNDLVLDLKAANIWTKMKALYPMIGGTAASHLVNLKTPGTFNLTFYGGWTHSASGATPNGTDGYADTGLIPNSHLTSNNHHLSFYSRTNNSTAGYELACQSIQASSTQYGYMSLSARYNTGKSYHQQQTQNANVIEPTEANSLGFFNGTRTSSTSFKAFKNGALRGTNTATASVIGSYLPVNSLYLSAYNLNNNGAISTLLYSNRQCAFASIGDGLTDLESQLFYQIVEKYQKALSRNVDTDKSFYFNRSYANETNAFIFNAGITDATQMSATHTLVTTLTTAGIWSKMKAVYPMVGGTVLAHKFNLVNPIDANASYRLSFNGGWTHDSLGAKPNGTNAYASTFLTPPSTQFSSSSIHISYYNVTNSGGGTVHPKGKIEIGAGSTNRFASLGVGSGSNLFAGGVLGGFVSVSLNLGSGADPRGFIVVSRTSLIALKSYKNGTVLSTNTTSSPGLPTTGDFNIGSHYFSDGNTQRNNFSDRQAAFISFGSGLTDAEVTTLTNAVQAFQTTLGRQV